MPQENQVLRCYSCKVFQVHLVKKARKWECKMCGSKQSLKKSYGTGSGKDCRLHVMKLNRLQFSGSQTDDCSLIDESEKGLAQNKAPNEFSGNNNTQIESKWLAYFDDGNEFPSKSFENSEWEICHETVNSKCYDKNRREMEKFCDGTKTQIDLKLFEGNNNPHWFESVKGMKEKEEEEVKKHSVLSNKDYSFKTKSKWLGYINEEILEEKERMSGDENEPVVVLNKGFEMYHTKLSDVPEKLSENNNSHVLRQQQYNETRPSSSKYIPQGSGTTLVKTGGENEEKKENLKIFNALSDIDNLDEILDF